MLTVGTTLELMLEKPVAGGRMLARHEGQVVLVAGAIPGERVRARIDRVTKGLAFATTTDVVQASSARRVVEGDPLCGGNVYAHVAYAEQAAIKREVLRDALRHGGRIEWPGELPVTTSPEQGYRMRARLHVRRGRIGFFREGTHDLCDCAGTGQLLPAAIDAARAFADATPRAVLDTMDAIELTESIAGDQRVLHIVWTPHARISRASLADAWPSDRLASAGITGISCDDPATGRARTVAGQPWVSDPIACLVPGAVGTSPSSPVADSPRSDDGDASGTAVAREAATRSVEAGSGATLRRHATSFFQANRFLLTALVTAVHRVIPAGVDRPVVDLYAGVGLFAVTLAARGQGPVIAVEGDPSSARDLVENARPYGETLQVEHAPVEQFLERAIGRASTSAHTSAQAPFDPAVATIIVDPPRTGMSKPALDGVLRSRVSRIVYVSCDVATLSRDLRRILDAGYRLDHLEAFDLFPNTAHVESLAVLSRTPSSSK